MIVRRVLFAAALTVGTLFFNQAHACGPDTDCSIGERTYRIALPAEKAGRIGAIVFMHGYRGTAEGVMNNTSLRAMAEALGVALVAPKSGGEDWLIRNAPRKAFRDDSRELAFFDALLADATARFNLDPSRILATGFSAGGMMTWTLACHRAESFAAFAPIAGTFWADIPTACPGPPVDLVHVHGTTDGVVPLAGRPIADTHQGDVEAVLAMMRRTLGYTKPVTVDVSAMPLSCEGNETETGRALILCLHEGGHNVRAEWIRWAYTIFVAR